MVVRIIHRQPFGHPRRSQVGIGSQKREWGKPEGGILTVDSQHGSELNRVISTQAMLLREVHGMIDHRPVDGNDRILCCIVVLEEYDRRVALSQRKTAAAMTGG